MTRPEKCINGCGRRLFKAGTLGKMPEGCGRHAGRGLCDTCARNVDKLDFPPLRVRYSLEELIEEIDFLVPMRKGETIANRARRAEVELGMKAISIERAIFRWNKKQRERAAA